MNLKNAITGALPTYGCFFPYSKIKTKFRPFLVKEEKKLLILEETSTNREKYEGIIEVLNECFDGVDFTRLPLFEVEYAFLKLRAKSVGEIVTPKIICPITGENHMVEIDLNQVEMKIPKKENVIQLAKDLKIYIKYPTIREIENQYEDINELVAECITYFENTDEKIERNNFSKEEVLDFLNHLTVAQYGEILDFFEKMPSVVIDAYYRTSDGVERKIEIKGLKDFFS
jgi:hypothetical protein